MGAHLEVCGLTKHFGANAVLEEVSLAFERGAFVSVVGVSGCGKTTLLRIIAGLEPATRGVVKLDSTVVTRNTPRIGFVFQEHALFPWRTTLQNVEIGLEIAHVPRRRRRRAAEELIRTFGLEGCEGKYPKELSGGMRQRVAIARTVITEPELVLLDEPFNALDGRLRKNLQCFLLDVWASRRETVLFVTHSVDEALFMSDHVVVLSSGPARVIDVVQVDLPRPRIPWSPEIGRLRERILTQLEAVSLATSPAQRTSR